jgi:hypothetical protein
MLLVDCRANLVRVAAASSDDIIPEEGFSLAKVSFGDILSPVGTALMIFGFGAYFQLLPGSSLSGVALIYGFPMLLLGFALKYAQLTLSHVQQAVLRLSSGLPR